MDPNSSAMGKQEEKVVQTMINPDQCQYFVARKHRQCKFKPAEGSLYCHAHASDLANKIECPFEKGMYIDSNKYESHLQNCPKVKNKRKQEQSEWYSKDINNIPKGGQNQPENAHIQSAVSLSCISLALQTKVAHQIVWLYQKHLQHTKHLEYISSQPLEHIPFTNDHLQASLLADIAHAYGLISPDNIYIQFGAGKGILSYAIAKKVQEIHNRPSKNVLLQKESRRLKFDRNFKENPYFQRYKSDVSHFDFRRLPAVMAKSAKNKCSQLTASEEDIASQLSNCTLVGVCKHMCGEALDISARGLLQSNCNGAILASCCHHLCNYNSYLNVAFFEQEGLSPEEIQLLFKLSSWGTKACQISVEESTLLKLGKTAVQDYSHESKVIVGRMAKRVIDIGRARFLQGKIQRYCSDQLTPENYVIFSKGKDKMI